MSKFTPVEQKRMLELLGSGNCTKVMAADILGVNRSTIYYNLEKLQPRDDSNGIIGTQKVGRKFKLSAQQESEILEYVELKPFAIYAEIVKELKLNISFPTLSYLLKRNGIGNYIAGRKPFINLKNIALRLEFSNQYLNWNFKNWQKMIFTDESTFYTSFSNRTYVKRPRGERNNIKYIIEQEKQTQFKLNIFGVMIYNHPIKIFKFEDKMSTHDHFKIMKFEVLPYIQSICNGHMFYQQDNSPTHNIFAEYLDKNQTKLNLIKINWPPKSADLSPIENIFGITKRKLECKLRGKTISNSKKFYELIERTFKEVEIKTVNNLFESMEGRMSMVIANKGKAIRY